MTNLKSRYLDLLKQTLTDAIYDTVAPAVRQEGRDWPARGVTMIGRERLDQLQRCIEDVVARGVPGDFLEAGVWRGGAAIFMRSSTPPPANDSLGSRSGGFGSRHPSSTGRRPDTNGA